MRMLYAARRKVNQRLVDLQVWRADRRRYRDRVLLVPHNWAGSVQTFYHFLLGYFGPMTVWLEAHQVTRIQVRDCGPMNVWFDYLPAKVDAEVIGTGVALGAVTGGWMRYRVIEGFDDPARFDKRKLLMARDAMLRALDDPEPLGSGHVVVVDRRTAEEFHRGPMSETEMSGSDRRSVPNLGAVIASLSFGARVEVVDTARMKPDEQVRLFRGAKALIGQHGAGLAHMIWMDPGSTIIEIHPPLPPEAVETFAALAQVLGHVYLRVPQESVHADIDLTDLTRVLERAGLLT